MSRSRAVMLVFVGLATATAATGMAWIWTGDPRWGATFAFPFSAFILNFCFLPLILHMTEEI